MFRRIVEQKRETEMERASLYSIIFIFTLHCIHAQNQTGFISLDCGLSEAPYDEFSTNLRYTSDFSFIQSGESRRLATEFHTKYTKPYLTLRYFPRGLRNCFSINVTRHTRYLIKASFVYGNYDGRKTIPSFDLHFGPNLWASVYADDTTKEMIHTTNSKFIQVCLVRTGATTPIINILELRPLKNDDYINQSGSLKLIFRRYLSYTTTIIRYPVDVYDRRWEPYFNVREWMPVTTTSNIVSFYHYDYDIPQAVMETAAIPRNVNSTLNMSWVLEYPSTQVYLYMHFAELQNLTANETREFNILLNGQQVTYGPLNPKPLVKDTISFWRPETCSSNGACYLELEKTNNSTLPPLLNAIEAFTGFHFPVTETNEVDVASIKNIQNIYDLRRVSWQGDPCVPKKFLWDGLNCDSSDNYRPPIIISLNMSSSNLTGNITQVFLNLTHLQQLDLSNNSLVGEIPDFLATMKSLVVINLSGNNLSGALPQSLLLKKGLQLNIQGNPHLFWGNKSCESKPKDDKDRKKVFLLVTIIASIGSFTVGALLVFFVLKMKKSSNVVEGTQSDHGISRSPELAMTMMTTKNRQFTYSEVVTMTNNFQRVLGKGGSGMVYHGAINGTEEVAVKLLSHSTVEGYKQFKAEVQLLLKVYHKNLVSLVGYCNERDNVALIYEYMANGDLKKHLSTGSSLKWRSRLKILIEAAQGLEYLHNGCNPLMVHRDVKTANILLNEHFEAKLADFGLSKSFSVDGDTHVSTVIAGTPGYLDPEYCRSNRLTEKTDVYSFGIVLLEMITNQRVIDQSRERIHITEWAEFMLSKGDIKSIIDPCLKQDFDFDSDSGSVSKIVELSRCCVDPISARRPTMSEVVIELKESLASDISKGGESSSIDLNSSIAAFSNEFIRQGR